MERLVLKELPRYECLVEASRQFPDLQPAACEAFMHMMRASEEAMRLINANWASHNITNGRFLVMILLMQKGGDCPTPTTPAELAECASVSRATITGLLDTLERDGFVSREPDPADRRQMSVHLTLKGQAFMHEILPGHFRLMTQIMGNLSDDERQTLARLLTKVSMQAISLAPGGAEVRSKAEGASDTPV